MAETTLKEYENMQIQQGELTAEGAPDTDVNDIFLIEEPYNPFDPVVIFDNSQEKNPKPNQVNDEGDHPETEYQSTKVEGTKVPILYINSMAIDPNLILDFCLSTEEFLPELEFTLNDPKRQLESIGGVGLTNVVLCIMIPEYDGLHRPITLPFYIQSCIKETTTQTKYICKYRHLTLDNVMCQQIGNKPLTTFELCSEVAKICSLGFAEGPQDSCKFVNDARYRQVYSQKLSDYVEEQVAIGGLDENGIFDCWIDVHGFLVLENLAKLFSADIKTKNLVIATRGGWDNTTNDDWSAEPHYMPRIISNYLDVSDKSLQIKGHPYPYFNSKKVQEVGSTGSYYYLTSVGKKNILVQEDVQMIEDSLEGFEQPGVYEFSKIEYIGADQTGDKFQFQRKVRDKWIKKKASKQVIVEMLYINFGLERGTIISMMVNESDPDLIAQQLKNQANAVTGDAAHYGEDGEETQPTDAEATVETMGEEDMTPPKGAAISEKSVGTNVTYSGLYYIDGIRYRYNKSTGHFTQSLFLIKLGFSNQLYSFASSEKATPENTEILSGDTPGQTGLDIKAAPESGITELGDVYSTAASQARELLNSGGVNTIGNAYKIKT